MDEFEIKEISIDEARRRLDEKQAVFFDIRDEASYREAHIPGAIHVNDGNIAEVVRDADKLRPTIIYCYHGNSSFGAAGYFMQKGFAQVWSMSGGFENWRGCHPHTTD